MTKSLNYPLKYNDINAKTKELSTEMNIEEYMIKILYYHYYNKEENNTITLEEFTNFILKETQNNEKFQNMITTSQIEKLKYISNPYEIQKERDVQTLARILEIEEDKIEDILTYYNSKTNTLELTLKECVNFIINEVLTDPKYTKIFNEETLVNLKTLETYIDEEYITQELNAQELSSILNISEEDIKLILLLKYSQTDNGLELTLKDFTTQVKNLKDNTEYLKEIDITAIEKISIFTDEDFIIKPLSKQELSNIFGVEIIKEIYNIKNLQDTDTLNVKDVVEIILEIDKTITILDEKAKEELNIIKQIIENTLNEPQKTYTSIEIAELLKTNQKTTNTLYALIELTSNNAKWTMSISETINIIINTEEITGKIDEEKLKSIKQIDTIMQTTLNNTKLNSQKTSEILGIDKTNIDLLYGLYTTKYINKEISIKKLIDTLETEIINNDNYEEGFSEIEKNKITNIKKLMDDSINRRKYTKEEMHTKLNLLTNEIDKKDIELMYIYYGSINNYNEEWTITIEEITNYLNDEIIHDERFTKFIDEDTKENIKQAKEKVKKAKALLVGKNYSRIIINTKYQSESEETYKYIETLKDELQKDWVESYIIGDSSMAYEMDKTFAKEFNFISVLTIISLIIVVGIAFKSFIIPVILVLLIQTAVYLTMGILSITVGSVYFIAILVVQSILMGATIDYAIVYTSYYLENRKTLNVKESILKSYESSIHTIMTSASILIIVTLILGIFAKDITSKICMTISEGTLCSSLLILLVLPGTLAAFDKKITKKIKKYDKIK
ncbi:MAG: MMPL family transporter, partial [Bacilli bacterium]|nr:MMPL family transporter [Bacilli bacterium]